METNVSYSLAGTFILIMLGFIVVAIIWLSTGLNADEYTYYKVFMKESVSGLTQDGPVEFNGVEVGTVNAMKINKENPQLIELLLKVKADTPITLGTKAKLSLRSLTGMAFILLEDKGEDKRPLLAEAGYPFPVIPTTPSILVRLDTTLTQINDSFRQISKAIKSLLTTENLASIRNILLSGRSSMQLIQTETIPTTNLVISNIGTLTQSLTDLAAEIKENPSVVIRGKAQSDQLGPGEK